MRADLPIRELDVISYAQPGGVFYACAIGAADIVNRLEVRRRSERPEDGMQRDGNPGRIREVSNYARENNAVFPTPIIVSANSEVVKIDGRKISFPDDRSIIGHVLDGQHRLLGLKNLPSDQIDQYTLLIVFVFDIDVYSEATIFATINSTQKQVSKSLMYDLFSLNPGRSVEKTCHEIVRSLNDDESSPFYKKIKLLGKKMGEEEVLSQAAFVDQISRQIRSKNGPLFKFYDKNEDWIIRKIISNCFSAVVKAQDLTDDNIFPENYFFRTTGFGGVAQTLIELVEQGLAGKDVSEKYFLKIFTFYFKSTR
ncbi:MAG: hypothetical protein RLZZ237_1377, partial [Pseudomonadota bacterium]